MIAQKMASFGKLALMSTDRSNKSSSRDTVRATSMTGNSTVAWSASSATRFCFCNASLYVVAMYLIPKHIRVLPRDNPLHMKWRMVAAVLVTVVSVASFVVAVPVAGGNHFEALGFTSHRNLQKLVITALLMCIFYLGPLATFIHFAAINMQSEVNKTGVCTARNLQKQSRLSILSDLLLSDARALIQGPSKDKWMVLRNIIIAPITEEIVYRSVLAPALHLALVSSQHTLRGAAISSSSGSAIGSAAATYSPWMVVWVNPLWFGLAHMHHLIEKIHSGWPVKNALISTAVQLTYTSIFGCIATLLLLRTGSIYTSILSHCICNSVGLPDTSFLQPPGRADSSEYSCLHHDRYLHLILHALGLVLFTLSILPLTETFAKDSIYWGA